MRRSRSKNALMFTAARSRPVQDGIAAEDRADRDMMINLFDTSSATRASCSACTWPWACGSRCGPSRGTTAAAGIGIGIGILPPLVLYGSADANSRLARAEMSRLIAPHETA
jgi:hypothetical protein